MKIKELKEKTNKELESLLAAKREEMRDLRFKVVMTNLKDVRSLRIVKKDIAQIMTVININKEKI